MKRHSLIFLLLFVSGNLFSQTKGLILDRETNIPIEYVNIWIADEEIGTTTDKDGLFFFKENVKNKFLIVSSIGYEKKEIQVDSSYIKIYLSPKSYDLKEVVVKPRIRKEITVGQYRRSNIHNYQCPNTPQILARFFLPTSKLNDNQLISSIKFETFSTIDATVNLRFFNANDNGEPDEDILKSNYLIKIKKGRRTTKVDNLDYLRIQIPKTGIFIAFEYLIIKENEYQHEFYDKELEKRYKEILYMPLIGSIKSDTSINSWIYTMGKWEKGLGKTAKEWEEKNSNRILAIELILID